MIDADRAASVTGKQSNERSPRDNSAAGTARCNSALPRRYPRQPFANLLAARQWVGTFVQWYNHEHRHSAIRFVTPGERHAGLDTALLGRRVEVYEAAKARHPERWSGATRNWQPIAIVYLNPDQHLTAQGDGRKEQLSESRKVA